MKKNNQFVPIIISVILFICMLLTITPILKNIKFGLDLQGGFEVLYQVKPLNGKIDSAILSNTYKTIQRRIDVLGVSEPSITIEGEDRIRVQLAGVTNQEEARKILGKQASLTFRDTNDNLLMTSEVLKSGGAKVGQDANGRPAVALSIKDYDTFYEVTKQISQSSDQTLVIWLDYEPNDSYVNEKALCGSAESNCLSAARVSQAFSGDVIIQGNFKEQEVKDLVELINSGSLPAQLEEISSKTVGASFGANSLEKTFTAGVIGIALIMLFMTIYYHLSGLIASLGILIYTYLTFLIFYLIGGVLTLPGIAALIIGVGMAVDTNVISFARIKDELKRGSSLKVAFQKGNKNSLLTIIDSNVTTFLVALILFILGESSIKGFATMLMISIIVTMIAMLGITRWLLSLFVKNRYFDKHLNLFLGTSSMKKSKLEEKNFVKNKKFPIIYVSILILVGALSLIGKGLNLGLEFKGGTSITLKTEQELTNEQINEDLKELGFTVVSSEFYDKNNIGIQIENVLNQEEVYKAENYFQEKYNANTDIGVISNVVKKDLVKNAIFSLLFASIAIIIYIAIRFQLNYAIGGILALVHDVWFVVVIFSLFSLEVNTIFIAAILSIIGYSINDTIVTFDRIRENLKNVTNKNKTKEVLEEVVNTSLKQTIARSIITTLTTIIPVICLIIFGSHEITNFNIALLIGFLAGTYSSLFLATQIWLFLEKKTIGKPEKKKWYDIDEVEELSIKGINS